MNAEEREEYSLRGVIGAARRAGAGPSASEAVYEYDDAEPGEAGGGSDIVFFAAEASARLPSRATILGSSASGFGDTDLSAAEPDRPRTKQNVVRKGRNQATAAHGAAVADGAAAGWAATSAGR